MSCAQGEKQMTDTKRLAVARNDNTLVRDRSVRGWSEFESGMKRSRKRHLRRRSTPLAIRNSQPRNPYREGGVQTCAPDLIGVRQIDGAAPNAFAEAARRVRRRLKPDVLGLRQSRYGRSNVLFLEMNSLLPSKTFVRWRFEIDVRAAAVKSTAGARHRDGADDGRPLVS